MRRTRLTKPNARFFFLRFALAVVLVATLYSGGCSEETTNNTILPTDPGGGIIVSPATNCAKTTVPGEIRITDASTPASAISRVSGSLQNPAGADVCAWAISREGNLEAAHTCTGLSVTGEYSFRGNIILNTGQDPTPVNGTCTLETGV